MKTLFVRNLRKCSETIFCFIFIAGCSGGTPQSPAGSTAQDPAGVSQQSSAESQPGANEPDLVIRGGWLLDMVSDEPNPVRIKGLIIRDGNVADILAADSSEELPDAAEVIDASSDYILPGLIDPHVHFRPWTPSAAIWRRGHRYYGVTTLQDFSPCGSDCKVADANEWLLAFKDLVNNSPISSGPALYIAGKKLDGGPEAEPQAHGHILNSPDEVAPYIDYLAGLGVDLINLETYLPAEYRRIAVEEGIKRRLPVTGHSTDAKEVILAGEKFIEHMYPIVHSMADEPPDHMVSPDFDYLMDLSKAPDMIKLIVENDVYINPTMTSRYGRLSERAETFTREDEELFKFGQLYSDTPEEFRPRILAAYRLSDDIDETKLQNFRDGFQKIQSFLQQLSEAGGMIVAGTDTTAAKMPGLTMHRELDMLVDAGITPYRALLGATRWPAQMIYKDDLIGTIETGKQADILILGSNPADDIANTRDIRYVIRQGSIQRSPDDCSVIEPPISQSCW